MVYISIHLPQHIPKTPCPFINIPTIYLHPTNIHLHHSFVIHPYHPLSVHLHPSIIHSFSYPTVYIRPSTSIYYSAIATSIILFKMPPSTLIHSSIKHIYVYNILSIHVHLSIIHSSIYIHTLIHPYTQPSISLKFVHIHHSSMHPSTQPSIPPSINIHLSNVHLSIIHHPLIHLHPFIHPSSHPSIHSTIF